MQRTEHCCDVFWKKQICLLIVLHQLHDRMQAQVQAGRIWSDFETFANLFTQPIVQTTMTKIQYREHQTFYSLYSSSGTPSHETNKIYGKADEPSSEPHQFNVNDELSVVEQFIHLRNVLSHSCSIDRDNLLKFSFASAAFDRLRSCVFSDNNPVFPYSEVYSFAQFAWMFRRFL